MPQGVIYMDRIGPPYQTVTSGCSPSPGLKSGATKSAKPLHTIPLHLPRTPSRQKMLISFGMF